MASYKFYMMCVVLCTVHSVHSYSIRGTIQHNNGAESEVKVSNFIDGENWTNTKVLILDLLIDTGSLPALTLSNFQTIETLNLTNISLENVPAFVNTSITNVHIVGNKIKRISANAFSEPRPSTLDLSNNEIQTMADRSVNVEVRWVILKCNQISQFSQSWFEDPGKIQALDLTANQILHIQDGAFNQMTWLEMLQLGDNHITSIGSEAFSSGIKVLFLQFNDIAQLRADMFTHRDTPIGVLLLHHNQLSYLPEALLLKLKPQHISLFGNPWQCQCLRDIERWLREVNSTRHDILARRDEPVCVVPLSFQYLCIPVADKELQKTYATGLSPVQGCWATPCQCKLEDTRLATLT